MTTSLKHREYMITKQPLNKSHTASQWMVFGWYALSRMDRTRVFFQYVLINPYWKYIQGNSESTHFCLFPYVFITLFLIQNSIPDFHISSCHASNIRDMECIDVCALGMASLKCGSMSLSPCYGRHCLLVCLHCQGRWYHNDVLSRKLRVGVKYLTDACVLAWLMRPSFGAFSHFLHSLLLCIFIVPNKIDNLLDNYFLCYCHKFITLNFRHGTPFILINVHLYFKPKKRRMYSIAQYFYGERERERME